MSEQEPERLDAPNQQVVGGAHPSEEGTGGEPGTREPQQQPQQLQEPQQQDEEEEKPPKRARRRETDEE